MVSIQHKIRWTFHFGSYHRIMKDVSWRLHRTKMKLRAYYITLHLQQILYTFLFLLHSTFAANVWWCIHRRSLILELLLFLLCADLRNLYKVYSCTIIIQCYTSSNTADDETTMLVSLRSRIKTTCTNVWSCVLPLHILVYSLDKKLSKRSTISILAINIKDQYRIQLTLHQH